MEQPENQQKTQTNTPNLTLDYCGGRTALKKGGVRHERYASAKECSKFRNIPREVLLLCYEQHAPGIKGNNEIFWEELSPWLTENYTQLLAEVLAKQKPKENNDWDKWELRKLKAEVAKLENQNKAKDKDFINRKLVLKTLRTLYGNVFAKLSRFLEYEQPSKCDRMPAEKLKKENKEFLYRLLSDLKNQETIWEDAEDIKTEGADNDIPE